MEGRKFDSEKPRMELIPPRAMVEVAKVLTFGAQKYDDDNWKKLDNLQKRYTGGTLRHVFATMEGIELDDETELHHEAHAICCLLFKLEKKLLDIEAEKPYNNGKKLEKSIEKENSEKRPRESESVKLAESTEPFDAERWLKTYNQERSLRNSEHRVQYDPTDPSSGGL